MEINNTALEQIREYVRGAMAESDPSHDYAHIRRVVGLTRKLCQRYAEADAVLAEAIALLHEMRDDKLFGKEREEELLDFLSRLEVPRLVFDSIALISFRKVPVLGADALLEVKIVQDADRLDAMGAMGIARAFAYGGAKGHPLYGDSAGTIQHFQDKLFRLSGRLNTEEARAMAEARDGLMKEFYDHFYRELEEADDGTV